MIYSLSCNIKSIRNSVTGSLQPFSKVEQEIINTPAFRRLKKIFQMSTTDEIYPDATSTRYSHSLGVHEVALKVGHHLEKDLKKLKFTKKEILKFKQLLCLAGLLHDIGHGPYSHAIDSLWRTKETGESHEKWSARIILETNLRNIIDRAFAKKELLVDAQSVARLIYSKGQTLDPIEKLAQQLISGELDIDRMDYLLRDSKATGVSYGLYDLDRTISILKILKVGQEYHVGIEEDGIPNLKDFLRGRISMFEQVHTHKLKRILDYHLSQVAKLFYQERFPDIPLEYYLEHHDATVMDFAKTLANYENRHARALIERKPYKVVLESRNRYSTKINKIFDRFVKTLEQKKLASPEAWYRDRYDKKNKITEKNPIYMKTRAGQIKKLTNKNLPELDYLKFDYQYFFVDSEHPDFKEIKKLAKKFQKRIEELN